MITNGNKYKQINSILYGECRYVTFNSITTGRFHLDDNQPVSPYADDDKKDSCGKGIIYLVLFPSDLLLRLRLF